MSSTKTIKHIDRPHQSIIAQINQVNTHNQKLIAISQHIINHSIPTIPEIPLPIITQIQQQLRAAFNKLIEALQEYFKSIDQRLIQVEALVRERKGTQQLSPRQQRKEIEMLTRRIQQLEHSVKKSQQNESKMLDIIQKIVEPRQQSTKISQQKEPTQQQLLNIIKSQPNTSLQVYPRPYSINDSCQVSFKKQPSVSCFPHNNVRVNSIPLYKRSLKGQRQAQQARKSHKMKFMVDLLRK